MIRVFVLYTIFTAIWTNNGEVKRRLITETLFV